MSSKLGKIVADFRTSLATKISVGGTTASLQSNLDDDGIALPDGTYFFTIDGDSSQKEHIVATNTGGNLTDIKSISRQGVQTAGVKREHRVGAAVTITDFAHIKYLNDLLDGTTDLDGSKPLKYDIDPTISDDKHLATKKYVGDAFSGVVGTASSTVSGTTKLSSDPVTPNNPVALNSEEVSATSGANKVPKANANGLIDSGFIIDNAADSGLEEGANGGTKVKVKTAGGILIDADGLSVDSGTTADKLVQLDGSAKLPAVDGSQLINLQYSTSFTTIASDFLRTSANTETSIVTGTTPTKVKEILFNDSSGTMRIKFDLKRQNGIGYAYGRIYKNGVALGTQQSNDGTSYIVKSEDLSFSNGDLIQLYIYGSSAETQSRARNLRVYYDKVVKNIENTVNLN